ncbi:MAG: hypothetical protein P8124_02350 [Gammaproteobacteria bacterium]
MRRVLFVFLLCVSASARSADRHYAISIDDWARPHDGRAVVHMQPLAQAVQALTRVPNAVLVINYPGGEQGSLWAHELRSWLVALGIPSRRLRLAPGSQREDALDIQVVHRGTSLP